jgi:Ca2+-binding EF-hand superfamily protein
MEIKTITYELCDPNKNKTITFAELLNAMNQELESCRDDTTKEELMNQPVIISLYDDNGKIFNGKIVDLIGWLACGSVLMVGDLTDVDE